MHRKYLFQICATFGSSTASCHFILQLLKSKLKLSNESMHSECRIKLYLLEGPLGRQSFPFQHCCRVQELEAIMKELHVSYV